MTPKQIELVQGSFAQVAPIAEQAAALFYDNLFSADPALKPLFKGNMQEQGQKLMQMIGVAVGKLSDLPALVPVLQHLGRRHKDYGVVDAHYATVGGALLLTLSQGLGDAFTDEVRDAWTTAYGLLASTMSEAANA
ncbi:Hemoglobin-like flavoprotein [Pseudomonas benzenivorans]|jgi:hemoglobin-like flavoprotein|nr:globin family protein [Pseudomonas benzenivorans]SDG55860.1 Hemoglobin-like flavoprotein [Pseudomonas benzenivorans]